MVASATMCAAMVNSAAAGKASYKEKRKSHNRTGKCVVKRQPDRHDLVQHFAPMIPQTLLDSQLELSQLDCRHFKQCSGCTLNTELAAPPVFNIAKAFFNARGEEDFQLTVGDIWEWRRRARLAVRRTSGNIAVGLFAQGTHTVVEIPHCRCVRRVTHVF